LDTHPNSWLLTVSERLYASLLHLYPQDFRRSYQQEMIYTFRDYAHDTIQRAGAPGLLRMWSIVFSDLLLTTCMENYRSCMQTIRMFMGLEKESIMVSPLLQLDFGSLTDIGLKRANNEDTMVSVLPTDPQVMQQRGALFIVADGMGGHSKGEVASDMIVNEVKKLYYADLTNDIETALLNAIKQANELLFASQGDTNESMGTTCIAAVLHHDNAYIANIGDSRAYIVHQASIKQISRDHSWVAEQVSAGKLTPEEALIHPQRNVITRCIGTKSEVEIDLFTEQVAHGDTLVLCTDGLYAMVSAQEILTTVIQSTPEACVGRLIALANEHGGPDNITAVVARISLT
jgi:serine/threonine protein phosphatase PrpC